MPDIYVSSPKPEPLSSKKEETVRVPKKPTLRKDIPREIKKPRFMPAFIINPRDIRFETQEKKEKIVLLLRRHPVTNLPWMVLVVVIALVPSLLFRFLTLGFLPTNFIFILTLCWYLFTFAFAFERFLLWYFDVNLITDERVVDIDFPTLINREISSTKIDHIQEVNIKTGGFIRSLFNYGDVLMQTAGAIPEVHFEAVPDPGQVADIINQAILEEEQEKLEGRVS